MTKYSHTYIHIGYEWYCISLYIPRTCLTFNKIQVPLNYIYFIIRVVEMILNLRILSTVVEAATLMPHLYIRASDEANNERINRIFACHLLCHSPRHSWCSLSKHFFKHESKGTNGDSQYVYEHVNVCRHVKTVNLHRERGIRIFVQVAR